MVVDVEEDDSVEDEHPVKVAAVIPTTTNAAMPEGRRRGEFGIRTF